MSKLQKYFRRPDTAVKAIQLALDMDDLTYKKWGEVQSAAAGDWLVENEGDTYTVDNDSFQNTYRSVGPAQYIKTEPIWARKAIEAGKITTKEGETPYQAGDMIVFNNEDETDGYSMSLQKFEKLYEPADGPNKA